MPYLLFGAMIGLISIFVDISEANDIQNQETKLAETICNLNNSDAITYITIPDKTARDHFKNIDNPKVYLCDDGKYYIK